MVIDGVKRVGGIGLDLRVAAEVVSPCGKACAVVGDGLNGEVAEGTVPSHFHSSSQIRSIRSIRSDVFDGWVVCNEVSSCSRAIAELVQVNRVGIVGAKVAFPHSSVVLS